MSQRTDETLQPGESLTRVTSERRLRPGLVIRIWDELEDDWKVGLWWAEVTNIAEAPAGGLRAFLRDLRSGETTPRGLDHIVGHGCSAYMHPHPERLAAAGAEEQRASKARLVRLRSDYAASDFSEASLAAMEETLRIELEWAEANDRRFEEMREEFDIRMLLVRKIGEELNRRGGMNLMQETCTLVGRPRRLDMYWDGIGEWRG